MRDDFAIFILTHGRADRVFTLKALREFRYTGRVYYVVDDEDAQLEAYRERFGDAVLTFSKARIAEEFDEGDNFCDRRSVFYARNACWSLARKVGVRYFMECDDDYTGFYFRADGAGEYASIRAECLDHVIEAMIEFLAAIPALSIAMSQGGDHMGGTADVSNSRKAMNTFLCDVERPFRFVGRVNEDVNTYVSLSRLGGLFLTIPTIQVNQKQSQTNPGGMTELYKDSGTYVKSFYSVMYVPSAVKVGKLTWSESRIHHRINWQAAAAQIIREAHRKPLEGRTFEDGVTHERRQARPAERPAEGEAAPQPGAPRVPTERRGPRAGQGNGGDGHPARGHRPSRARIRADAP